VGHSYGGLVAMRAAFERPHRIASLSLYEPTCFALLATLGVDGFRALAQIRNVAQRMIEGVTTGSYAAAGASFVDFWSGAGTWMTLRPAVRAAVLRWTTKAPLEFRATFEDAALGRPLSALPCPTLLMRGEHAPAATRLITEALQHALPDARLRTIDGAGHMGPLTHAAVVDACIADHIGARAGNGGVEREAALAMAG
jgi:pimeloyl-ACP methyl ester carboxylesterase